MRSTSAANEAILTFGLFGSGKSHAWATWADWQRRFNVDGRFRVIACEPGAVARLSDGYPDFADNVEWTDAHDWMELVETSEKYLAASTRGDVLVVEGIDRAWDWVQQLWIETTQPRSERRNPFEAGVAIQDTEPNWVKINAEYFAWLNPIIRANSTPDGPHLFATAPQEELRVPTGKKGEWADSKEQVAMFSRYGYRPAGQKKLAHMFHSILWMRAQTRGVWTITSVDDHTRELLDNEPVRDFAADYLQRVARWDFTDAEKAMLVRARLGQ